MQPRTEPSAPSAPFRPFAESLLSSSRWVTGRRWASTSRAWRRTTRAITPAPDIISVSIGCVTWPSSWCSLSNRMVCSSFHSSPPPLIATSFDFDFFVCTEQPAKSAAIISPRMGETFPVDLGECLLFEVEYSATQICANAVFLGGVYFSRFDRGGRLQGCHVFVFR